MIGCAANESDVIALERDFDPASAGAHIAGGVFDALILPRFDAHRSLGRAGQRHIGHQSVLPWFLKGVILGGICLWLRINNQSVGRISPVRVPIRVLSESRASAPRL